MCRRSDPPEIIAGTSGRAIPGLEVRAVADGTRGAEPGEPGEIVVRGYTVMSGYWGNEDATAEAIDADGWLHTGDIGVMDEAGNVTITDRVKDMYVVGGFNAYPAEIEAILRGHEAVAQVAVVGVPDERMGEVGMCLCRAGCRREPIAATSSDERSSAGPEGSWPTTKCPAAWCSSRSCRSTPAGRCSSASCARRHQEGADHVVTSERSK